MKLYLVSSSTSIYGTDKSFIKAFTKKDSANKYTSGLKSRQRNFFYNVEKINISGKKENPKKIYVVCSQSNSQNDCQILKVFFTKSEANDHLNSIEKIRTNLCEEFNFYPNWYVYIDTVNILSK